MHATSLLSCLLLSVSIANAAPVTRMKRLDDLTENVNGVKDSTPVVRTCKLKDKGDSISKNCGLLSVAGLTTSVQGVALQIACLNDEAQCLKDGKAAAQCKTKRQTCEFENGTGKAQIRINQDNLSKDIVTNFFQVGTPACDGLEKLEGQDKPFICDVREEIPGSEGAILFTPSDKPSKFIEDNATGHTLIGEKLKKGPIGEGIKTTVVDNGDSTFTAGNLTTFSCSFVLQLGCLFDEADCKKAGPKDECVTERKDCVRANGLSFMELVLSQTQTKP